ncbi:deoxycytidylate deaminase [Microthyrium microscopicum]|uniref:Deoxycytidylate deaminase n=1 Tax=Microthyrium microscopicum TaxID=703497 RepID=A0A6A6TZS7_9PEZI|nr:deoxycytidylate deaminase [Microthyrium microscopicum]
MFIGICGGICAGKSTIAQYLINNHGFQQLHLRRTSPTPAVEKTAGEVTLPTFQQNQKDKSSTPAIEFDDADTLLAFVTPRWRENWVTTDIHDETVVDVFERRPFFLLISVDAPITVRWQRFRQRCLAYDMAPPDLGTFVVNNDAHVYSHAGGLALLRYRGHLHLLNNTNSLTSFYEALKSLDLTNESRVRPTWDQYFMALSDLAAKRSNCMKRQVGCVLVREKRVISTGYNGTPRGMTNCGSGGCPRCNSGEHAGVGLDTCRCLHAEENALLEAGRERIGVASTLYCNTCPCLTCSVKICQVGISEVVYSMAYSVDTKVESIFAEAGVHLRQFSPPRAGLIDLSAEFDTLAINN